jgi:hypothetical protein
VNIAYTPEREMQMIARTAAEVFPYVSIWHSPFLYSWVINGSLAAALRRESGRDVELTLTENRSVLLSFRRRGGTVRRRGLFRVAHFHVPPESVEPDSIEVWAARGRITSEIRHCTRRTLGGEMHA